MGDVLVNTVELQLPFYDCRRFDAQLDGEPVTDGARVHKPRDPAGRNSIGLPHLDLTDAELQAAVQPPPQSLWDHADVISLDTDDLYLIVFLSI